MKKFFNNMEVELISELPNNEVAIKLITGLHSDYDLEYGSNCDPIEQTLVVSKSQLKDGPITKDDVVIEREKMLKEISFKKNEMLNNANYQIRKEYQELNNEVKELKKQRDFLWKTSKQFETVQKIRDKKYKYVVMYGFSVKTFEEFLKEIENKYNYEDEPNFDDLYVRIQDGDIKVGNYNTYRLLENKQQLVDYLESLFSGINKFSLCHLETIDNWKLNIPKAEEQRTKIIKEHNDNLQKNIDGWNKSIQEHKLNFR